MKTVVFQLVLCLICAAPLSAAEAWRAEIEAADQLMQNKEYLPAALKLQAVLPNIDQPKDRLFSLNKLSLCYYALFRSEKDKEVQTRYYDQWLAQMHAIVYAPDGQDEQIKVQAALRLAEMLRNSGKRDEAIAALNQALVSPPAISPDNHITLLLHRAALEEGANWARQAEQTYMDAAAIDARDISLVADARNHLAEIYVQRMGKFEQTIHLLDYPQEDSVSGRKVNDSTWAQRFYWLSMAKQNLGQTQQALAEMKQAVSLCPAGSRIAGQCQLGLGILLIKMNQSQDGLKLFNELCDTPQAYPPHVSQALFEQAVWYESAGDQLNARKVYERIIQYPRALPDHRRQAQRRLAVEGK